MAGHRHGNSHASHLASLCAISRANSPNRKRACRSISDRLETQLHGGATYRKSDWVASFKRPASCPARANRKNSRRPRHRRAAEHHETLGSPARRERAGHVTSGYLITRRCGRLVIRHQDDGQQTSCRKASRYTVYTPLTSYTSAEIPQLECRVVDRWGKTCPFLLGGRQRRRRVFRVLSLHLASACQGVVIRKRAVEAEKHTRHYGCGREEAFTNEANIR